MVEREIHSRRSFRQPFLALLCLFVAGAAGSVAGCADDAPPPSTSTVRVRLDFGSGVTLNSVNYELTGPNGFQRTGTLPVGNQPTVTTTFQNLPAGQGYRVFVQGTASDNASTCRGEATFNVNPSGRANVQVALMCTGIAGVTSVINVCPVIDSLSAIPAETYVGTSIRLTSEVHDADNGPMPLSATWTGPAGTLSDMSAAGATFTCTQPGTFTVGLGVSDGQAGKCPDEATVTLVCTTAP